MMRSLIFSCGILGELIRERFHRALHVGLEDEWQLLDLALGDGAAEIFEL